MKTVTRVLAVGAMAIVSVAWAANPPAFLTMIPPQINYQGRLMTPTNSPYKDAAHLIDLTLYPMASGGAKLWSERYSVQTRDGYFSVNLGSGGASQLPSNNVPIWQVLWNFNGNETNELYMALTVRTGPDGSGLATPVESSPRQQFLTAPFAFRAHQSVYARKADAVFDASQGIQTPSISSTNGEIALNGDVRVPTADTIYANKVIPHGASPVMKLHSAGGQMLIGVETRFGNLVDGASSIAMGKSSDSQHPGTAIQIAGKSINLNTTNFTVRSLPMCVKNTVTVSASTSSANTLIPHGIDIDEYDVFITGWYYSLNTPAFRGVGNLGGTSVFITFTAIPSGGTVTMMFLGIRKGLTQEL
jgi:hypothetical protein